MKDLSPPSKEGVLLETYYNLSKAQDKAELVEYIKNLPLDKIGIKGLTLVLSPPWGNKEIHRVFQDNPSQAHSLSEGHEGWTFNIETKGVIIGNLTIFPAREGKTTSIGKEHWDIMAKILATSMVRILREKELLRKIKARDEELEEAVKELKRNRENQTIFMKRVAHELRTPLHSIIGFFQILEGEKDSLSDNARGCLDLIMDKAREITETIEDITLLWDMRKKESQINPLEIDLPSYLDEILESLSFSILEKRLKLKKEVKVQKAILDKEKMARAIHHLVSNAVKFTPEGGEIRIKASPVPTGIGLSVCDTGIGIPPQHMEEIWEPFKQLEDPLTRRYQGMGVGLSLVRQIVEAHGGEVWAERGKGGKGTCFVMIIPQPLKTMGGDHGRKG